MKLELSFGKVLPDFDCLILAVTQKNEDKKTKEEMSLPYLSKEELEAFHKLPHNKTFTAGKGETISFCNPAGKMIKLVGLGNKTKITTEGIRRQIATLFKAAIAEKFEKVAINLDSFTSKEDLATITKIAAEAIWLSNYTFDKYRSKPTKSNLKNVYLISKESKHHAKAEKVLKDVEKITSSINYARDLINEVPNVLNSEVFADLVEKDAKENLSRVKIKILNKAQIKKEGMNLLLSVNAGSAFEPRLVHLTYTPAKHSSKEKHYALVGKGITFDTGGYSLKPGTSMAGMKYDMAGAASVYAAFRAAVLLGSPNKLTCILALTDNAVNSLATKPDAVIKGRNGKTAEILNTDAEGRLILADAVDYACDQKPDAVIDAATLTGACLVALGKEVCAIMGNDQKLMDKILSHAKDNDEYLWQLPLIEEYRQDIKSKVADIKNIGTAGMAGTAKGAVFIEEFIQEGIAWAHLDIAGIAEGQTHLPYCPANGGSGIIVRTLTDFLMHA